MGRISFYLKYAWRSVLRGGQRSFFAVLCVGVGVASLVALESLSQSISDTLIGDTQARAGGDLIVRTVRDSSRITQAYNTNVQDRLNGWKNDGTLSEWTPLVTSDPQISGYFGLPPTFYAIDPAKYPLYGELKIIEPSGKSLRELLSRPGAVVISKNLWEKQKYQVGQEIQVNGGKDGNTATLKIVGQTSVDIPGVVFGPGQFFGFGFTSLETAKTFLSPQDFIPTNYFIKAGQPEQAKQVLKDGSYTETSSTGPYNAPLFGNVITARDQQEQIARGLNYANDMLSYVGLLSLLIGGIGVINTMLVVIGRRTTEIATVKALGLKTRQTLLIFTLEALILGVLGSVLGVFLGELLGLGIKGVAEGFFARPLNWGFYPGPIIIGLIVGILTAGVFGFLPSYAASRVRPGVVLRIQSGALPNIGGWASVLILLMMTLALGIIAGVLLRDLLIGIIISYATLLIILLMVGFMWLVVFLVGKLPAPFGPSVKMAFRSFSRHRGRTATTIMVMVVGLFFISFIVIIADSVKAAVREAFDIDLGYNVVAFSPFAGQTDQIKTKLQNEVPGLQKLFINNQKDASLIAINGRSAQLDQNTLAKPTPNITPGRNAGPNAGRTSGPTDNSASYPYLNLSGRGFVNGEAPGASGKQKLLAGRNLTAADADKNVLLLRQDIAQEYNLKVGDKVTVQSFQRSLVPGLGANSPNNSASSKTVDLEVIGLVDKGNSNVNFETGWIVPLKVANDLGAQFSYYFLLIDRAQMKPALQKIQDNVGFVLDLGDLIDTFSRLLDQFLAFPLLLSLLSLFSGAILIANNVALAMLERRTEIGVLKAIGAKQQRILRILLWESGLVGLLGGLIGVGTGVLIALNITALTGGRGSDFNVTWSPLTAGLLIALAIGLAIGATVVSAWGAIKEKPLVVLRYE